MESSQLEHINIGREGGGGGEGGRVPIWLVVKLQRFLLHCWYTVQGMLEAGGPAFGVQGSELFY